MSAMRHDQLVVLYCFDEIDLDRSEKSRSAFATIFTELVRADCLVRC